MKWTVTNSDGKVLEMDCSPLHSYSNTNSESRLYDVADTMAIGIERWLTSACDSIEACYGGAR